MLLPCCDGETRTECGSRLFTLLALGLGPDVAGGAVFVVVVLALAALVGGVVEQHAAGAVADGGDQLDGEVGVVLEAAAVRGDVAVAVGVHDLAGGNLDQQAAKGRGGGAPAVHVVHLVGVGDQLGLVEPLAELVHGHVLQLGHVEAVAEQVERMAAHRVLVLLAGVGQVRHVVEAALVEPLDEQLEAGGVVVRQLERILAVAVAGAGALELGLELLRVVTEQIAVQRPAATRLAHIDVDHRSGEQPVALQFSLCAHVQLVRVQAVDQRRPHCETLGSVYILSKGGSRHEANVAVRHSQPWRAVGKITIEDEPVVPSHAARCWRSWAMVAVAGASEAARSGRCE